MLNLVSSKCFGCQILELCTWHSWYRCCNHSIVCILNRYVLFKRLQSDCRLQGQLFSRLKTDCSSSSAGPLTMSDATVFCPRVFLLAYQLKLSLPLQYRTRWHPIFHSLFFKINLAARCSTTTEMIGRDFTAFPFICTLLLPTNPLPAPLKVHAILVHHHTIVPYIA